ncbi:Bug family tripartite tricarboxylate transporter substrate binding protein [Roseomonas chloroacetimidivorans]|uniref:Bug family tripartite tricarboxylate transporter substrate binding protein n=1 Tax=Roseomonas chloroacetimidivorans TaxID=1766656 RepID=UPI003C745BC1
MSNSITRRRALGGSIAIAATTTVPVRADNYPSKPVRVIVPFVPGGPIDQTARIVSQRLAELLGQPVIIENRTGANGVVAAETAARAPADGYTLLFSVIHHTVLPSLQQNLSYDIEKDFDPITLVAYYPIILVVRPNFPIHSVPELIARAKEAPGQLTFGHSGYGGGTHLAGELFAMQAGVQLRQVPYRGSAAAMSDLLGGHVDLMFSDAPTALSFVQAGQLRALGISTPRRSELLPDLPTIAESGLPGYGAYSWGGISAKAGTPAEVKDRIHSELIRVLQEPATRQRFLQIGAEPQPGTPAEYAAMMRGEIVKWAAVVRQANIRMD